MATLLKRTRDTDLTAGGPYPMHQPEASDFDRRRHRRHDFAPRSVELFKWDGFRDECTPLGTLLDLSASGFRLQGDSENMRDLESNAHVRVKLVLPDAAGVSPFVQSGGQSNGGTLTLEPANVWTGWIEVARVTDLGNGNTELGGRLLDMADLDRGMLKLYLSIHPLAA